ncbi:MAG: S53 family peptidase [Steroidobacteraceae bacterium]
MTLSKYLLAAALVASLAGAASAAPYPHRTAPAAADLGDSAAVEANTLITVTVSLKLSNSDQLDPLVQALYTPGSPQYRQFLTPEQFRARFAPSPATIAAVSREFTAAGLKVTQTATAQLHVSGTAAQLEREFGVQLHTFQASATAETPAYVYRKPMSAPRLPGAVVESVNAVLGLDTRPHLTPHLHTAAQRPGQSMPAPHQVSNQTNTPDPPGLWTVIDYADYYDVNPLYRQGLSGEGRTLAIVTFASMTESDAYYYWNSLGLKVQPNRINVVNVDGGPGAPSDAGGSIETTIDVQQSGGLAPGSKIIIYQAPNTNQGFVDAFAAAFDANRAETVSVSWGEWEGFDGTDGEIYFQNGPVTNPANGRQSTIYQALSDLFTQAAIQGQSMFAASGDNGAYDELGSLPTSPSPGQPYSYNGVLSVDDPAVQRYVTAAGGTTLPGTQVYSNGNGGTITLNIPTEQAWNWEYLGPLCVVIYGPGTPSNCFFPTGTGGGVSYMVDRPFYQYGVPNMANTVPGQTLYQLTPTVEALYGQPAHFPGRNVPDISTNADPQTGYIVYYTSSATGTLGEYQYGGTSFVGPELNGVTSLFVQALHGRIGLLNPALYQIETSPGAYRGRQAPYRDITRGNNWYWNAGPGYDQTTGVGVPNVANLLQALSYYLY